MNASAVGTDPVVTGIGVVAPTGIGVEAHWEAVLAGKSGITRIDRFDPACYPVRYAGQVTGFDVAANVPSRLVPQTDFWTQTSVAAARDALADAKIEPSALPEYSMGVMTAASSSGAEFGQHEMERLFTQGPAWVSTYQAVAWFFAATTGQLAIRHGMRGPAGVLCAEQAGGLDTLGHARRLIAQNADTRLLLTGGTDAPLCPYALLAQITNGKMSAVDDAATAYSPFSPEASGYLSGEGGAILILESRASAEERGITGYGSVSGYAAGMDPPPGSERPPALRRTIENALADAGLRPSDVDVVFADGAGVPHLDLAEAQAIEAVFGPAGVPVTVPKTLTGRLYAGGASLDVATALLALRDGVIPASGTVREAAAGYRIDLVCGGPRTQPLRTALVLARGHGGFTAALVVRRGEY
ncbi:ketosynthase chain-length factor [Amycolatopsis ultiminotia]|uniref:Ketosynthase chain-length factor n=1 Tax=Amycolatopsis ultiminotia TaxID=543629 RepID=A0ABP6XEY1_9PSEU